jgi:hypothetical protein
LKGRGSFEIRGFAPETPTVGRSAHSRSLEMAPLLLRIFPFPAGERGALG